MVGRLISILMLINVKLKKFFRMDSPVNAEEVKVEEPVPDGVHPSNLEQENPQVVTDVVNLCKFFQ